MIELEMKEGSSGDQDMMDNKYKKAITTIVDDIFKKRGIVYLSE